MRFIKSAVLVTVFIVASSTAFADEVVLSNGNKLEGKASVNGEYVTIKSNGSTITIAMDMVERIDYGPTIEEVFAEKLGALSDSDADGHYQLALWAKDKGLVNEAKTELLRVIAIEPDHLKGRTALGQTKYKGEWYTHDELMRLKGFVKFEGEWVLPAEREMRMGWKNLAETERNSAVEQVNQPPISGASDADTDETDQAGPQGESALESEHEDADGPEPNKNIEEDIDADKDEQADPVLAELVEELRKKLAEVDRLERLRTAELEQYYLRLDTGFSSYYWINDRYAGLRNSSAYGTTMFDYTADSTRYLEGYHIPHYYHSGYRYCRAPESRYRVVPRVLYPYDSGCRNEFYYPYCRMSGFSVRYESDSGKVRFRLSW